MSALEVGRICVKNRGKEKGKKAIVVDIIDNNFVLVTGPSSINKVKRRRANILHLDITDKKIEIPKGASDEEIEKKIKDSGLEEYMKT
ncbi:50S ribosomal protein L14e [Sulfolobales archaeon HS-7]|nr:50S ribosomal protein L14e [Sulfolobales archaeon HS-7]